MEVEENGTFDGKIYVQWKIRDILSRKDDIVSHKFPFMNTWLFLKVCPNSLGNPEFVYFSVRSKNRLDYSIEYTLCLEKLDGSIQQLGSGIFKAGVQSRDVSHFKLSDIEKQKSELLHSAVLSVTCTLTHGVIESDSLWPHMLDKPQLKNLIKYTLCLEKLDGSIEQLGSGIFKADVQSRDVSHFKLSDTEKQKSELLLSAVLSVTCTLTHGVIESDSLWPQMLDKPQLKNLIKLETLSGDLNKLFNDKDNWDATLHVKDKEYKAHKAILSARSSVFAAMFQHDTSEKQTGIVKIPDCDPESFGQFLEFLYCGKLEVPSPERALHLYETSVKYNIEELTTFCSEYLQENLAVENFCDVVVTANRYDDNKLLSIAQVFFNRNLNSILVTAEWDCLLKNNHRLANKFLIEMSSKIKIEDSV